MRREAYLGGRLVLGSGRTWPHDFLFLEDFFSWADVGEAPESSPPSSARTAASTFSSLND